MNLPTSRRIDPVKMALASAAWDSGLTSVNGISKASGIPRQTIRLLLSRIGRTVKDAPKAKTRRQIRMANLEADMRAIKATAETPEQRQQRIEMATRKI